MQFSLLGLPIQIHSFHWVKVNNQSRLHHQRSSSRSCHCRRRRRRRKQDQKQLFPKAISTKGMRTTGTCISKQTSGTRWLDFCAIFGHS